MIACNMFFALFCARDVKDNVTMLYLLTEYIATLVLESNFMKSRNIDR